MRCSVLLTMLLLLMSCASSVDLRRAAARDNAASREGALRRFERQRAGLVAFDPPVVTEIFGDTGALGAVVGLGGRLIALSGSRTTSTAETAGADAGVTPVDPPELGFVAGDCTYYRDGAQIVIVELVGDVHTRHVREGGTCVINGVEEPPPRVPIISLGVIDPAVVELVQLHYAYEDVQLTCDDYEARP